MGFKGWKDFTKEGGTLGIAENKHSKRMRLSGQRNAWIGYNPGIHLFYLFLKLFNNGVWRS